MGAIENAKLNWFSIKYASANIGHAYKWGSWSHFLLEQKKSVSLQQLGQTGGRGELVVVLDMTSQSGGGGEEENYNNLSARQHHGTSQYLQLWEMTCWSVLVTRERQRGSLNPFSPLPSVCSMKVLLKTPLEGSSQQAQPVPAGRCEMTGADGALERCPPLPSPVILPSEKWAVGQWEWGTQDWPDQSENTNQEDAMNKTEAEAGKEPTFGKLTPSQLTMFQQPDRSQHCCSASHSSPVLS